MSDRFAPRSLREYHQAMGLGAPEPTGSIAPTGSDAPLHRPEECLPEACPFHRPSGHPLERFPAVYNFERRGLVERLCAHGEPHPDPDHLAQSDRERPSQSGVEARFHRQRCDGCCWRLP
jgi:hypothetical protein